MQSAMEWDIQRNKLEFSNLIGLAALIIAIFIAWSLKEVIILIFVGVLIAMALCTLTGKIKKTVKLPRQLCLGISISSLILIFSIIIITIVPQFTKEFQELITQLPSAANAFREIILNLIDNFSSFFISNNEQFTNKNELVYKEFISLPDGVTLASGITDSFKKILNIAGNLGIGIIQTLFVLSISLMIAMQPESYREIIIKLMPSFYRRRARFILLKCGDALSNWMTGVLISSTFVSLLTGLILYLIGVKLVVANALIAGFLNIIPNIGPTISTIFPISVALLDAPWKSIVILISYIIIQNIESYIITPSVMQYQVKLLPGLTLTAQFVFTIIFGPIGLLVSLPLTVVIQVLTNEVIVHDILDKKTK